MRKTCLHMVVGLALLGSVAPLGAQTFGNAVLVGDDQVIIGEPTYDTRTGVVYVFEPDAGGNLAQSARLTASDGVSGDGFGSSVATDGDRIVVGAFNAGSGAGAAYVFARQGAPPGGWVEVAKLTAIDATAGDQFGWSAALRGDDLVIGAIGRNSGRGAVYIFAPHPVIPDAWSEVAVRVGTGVPTLLFNGYGEQVASLYKDMNLPDTKLYR